MKMLIKESAVSYSGQESNMAEGSCGLSQETVETDFQDNAMNDNSNTATRDQNIKLFRPRANSDISILRRVKKPQPLTLTTDSEFQNSNSSESRKRCHSLSHTDLTNSRLKTGAFTSLENTIRLKALEKYEAEKKTKAQYWVENENENDENSALWVENECPMHRSPTYVTAEDKISPPELFTENETTDLVPEVEEEISFDEETGKQLSPLNQTWQLDLAEGGFNNVVRGPDFNQNVIISDEMEFYETRRRRFSTRSSSNGSMSYPGKPRSSSVDAGSDDGSVVCEEKQQELSPLPSSFETRKSAILLQGRRRYKSCNEDIREEESTNSSTAHSGDTTPVPEDLTVSHDQNQPISRQRCNTTDSPRPAKHCSHTRKDSDSNLVIPDEAKWGSATLKKYIKINIHLKIELDLSDLKLIDLPSTVPTLTDVQSLCLEGNYIRSLPASMEDMSMLTNLDLSHNHLLHLPHNVKRCTNLNRLCLDNNYLHTLPDFLADLKHLSHLSLEANHFSVWPNILDKTTQLEYLNMSKNHKLSIIPEGRLGHLDRLRYFLLNDCSLKAIPCDISSCGQLHNLDLSSNNLTSLPGTMSGLTSLQSMNLSGNKFQHFPMVLCNIPHLHILDISSNLLQEIPPEVSSLHNLQYMNIQKNKLKHMLPEILCLLLLKRPKLGMVSRRESHQNSFSLDDKVSSPSTLQDSNPYI